MQEISVSKLVSYLKNKLDSDDLLQKISVVGEISNFHKHFSGHLYFTVKDEKASISCVMFKSNASSLKFEPKNGDKVIVYANTSIFESSGQLQLYILRMNLDGLGDLYIRYELLKEKLTKEGKFLEDHKIKLDKIYLDNVAVLVGDNSAAMSDIKRIFTRRWPLCNVDYYPVLVQGDDAPNNIIENLIKVDELNYDAIILSRGGGSFEDLFCFNDENLINCIYNLKTFIVSGVGHEQDFTLTDFVVDLRAATPTAAVELITPNIIDVIDDIYSLEKSLFDSLNYKYNTLVMKYDNLLDKLLNHNNNLINIAEKINYNISYIKNKLINYINQYNSNITHINKTINFKANFSLNNKQLTFKRLNTLLEAYSSQNVLKRGYTLVIQNNKVIKKKNDLMNNEFEIKFIDGNIKAIRKGD